MRSPLEEIAFLANSENRVMVLRSLTDGPHSRHVLVELVDVSRVTLGRILDELDARHWITQRGQVCEITPLGAWVVDEFTDLCEMMAGERKLRTVVQWLPDEGYGFHISRLASADITRVHKADASAPISKLVEQIDHGGRIRAFSFAITSQFLGACHRQVLEEAITYDWVFTPAVLDVLTTNPQMRSRSREMLESGRANFYHYEGDIPYVVIISEGLTNLRLADSDGSATALLQSDDAVVRSWAEATFDGYRRDATPLDAGTFAV